MADKQKKSIPLADESDLAAVFDMDEAKEKDGVLVQYGKLVVRIARMGGSNKKFAAMFEQESRPYRRMMEGGVDLPEEVASEILHKCFAHCIVKDWNLARGGELIPCTPENIIEQFQRRPEFFRFVNTEAQRAANYRKTALEDEAKN